MSLLHPLFIFKLTAVGVCVFEVKMPELKHRKHLCHMTLQLYVMKIIPLVPAAEMKMAACACGILPAFKSFNENLTFSQSWHQRLCMQMELGPVHHLSSHFHSLPAAAWSFIWASLTAVGFKVRVQAISHCLSLYLCSNLGKYKSGADANLGLFN